MYYTICVYRTKLTPTKTHLFVDFFVDENFIIMIVDPHAIEVTCGDHGDKKRKNTPSAGNDDGKGMIQA